MLAPNLEWSRSTIGSSSAPSRSSYPHFSLLSLLSDFSLPGMHPNFLGSPRFNPFSQFTRQSAFATKHFRIRTYEKSARNPFGIRTSKTQDLKPFRMNTYKKTGEGVPFQRWPPPRQLALNYWQDAGDHGTRYELAGAAAIDCGSVAGIGWAPGDPRSWTRLDAFKPAGIVARTRD